MPNRTKQGSNSPKGSSKNSNGNSEGIESSQLMKLFEEQLKDIYWAEKALTKALPKMVKNASSTELIEALENHLQETEEQVSRLEQVFELIEKKATAKKCEGMEGLIKEGQSIMEECESGAMCDAGIIGAGQKIEHYEISTYGTLHAFATTFGLTEVADLLEQTLNEEKTADEKLTEVAMSVVNINALHADDEEG
jgi:ferritin-like metal-binding protein YciE